MKKSVNYYFLALSLFLTASGLLFLSTLSAISSLQSFGNTTHYLFHQLIAVAIGLVIGVIVFKIPLEFLKKAALPLLIFNAFFLILATLPFFGTKLLGASRWISIGNNSIQPSEFFKISIILYISAWLSGRRQEGIKKNWAAQAKKGSEQFIKTYLPFLLFLGIVGGFFMLQRDISTLGIISVSLLVMYFVADTPLWNTLLTIIIGAGSLAFLVIKEPYRFNRLLTFLHPNDDPLGKGLQLKQSLIALGSGGWFGKGLGMSTQKFGFLPQAMSDSMFAIFGEELGIIGAVVLIAAFLTFLYLGFNIGANSQDKFAKLTAIGITTWIIFQAFINIASCIGLFPLSGIPLPFFSYGGSHIISELIGVGLLLNISKNG